MRIELDEDREVRGVYLFLSRAEVVELVGALEELMEHFDEEMWHAHVSSPDFQREITVAPDVDADREHPWDGSTWSHSMATPTGPDTNEE